MLCLYVHAPFAACRTFTAGWYRPTATFLTPSAAYGLILNVAGIESRLREEDAAHDGSAPATLMRPGLPRVAIALGAPPEGRGGHFPSVQTVYQQLHNYPVGASGQARAASAKGNKYNITPVRREFLADMRAFICIKDNDELEDRVRRGLAGDFNSERYGVPFLGDNAFLIDRLEVPKEVPSALWYRCIREINGSSPRPRTARLTCWIDRADLSRTRSALYAPDVTVRPATDIPEDAWTAIPPRE
jgi:CRISPR-associated protein Cas5t